MDRVVSLEKPVIHENESEIDDVEGDHKKGKRNINNEGNDKSDNTDKRKINDEEDGKGDKGKRKINNEGQGKGNKKVKRKIDNSREDIFGNKGNFKHILWPCPYCGEVKGAGRLGKHMSSCPKKVVKYFSSFENEKRRAEEEKREKIP